MEHKATQQVSGRVVLRDETSGKWLEFTSPLRILQADQVAEVMPLVRQIEVSVQQERCYAAGFISYEAAPAFDPALPVKADTAFPLLWFGLFERVREISLPDVAWAGESAGVWHPSVGREEYERCLHAIRAHLLAGDSYQVNLTYRLRAVLDIDPWHLFTRLVGDDEVPFAGFVDTGEWVICSASPELFLRIEGQQLESRPMKGTSARGRWIEDDRAKKEALLGSAKERAENAMIVDMVRNDFGRIATPGSVRVASLLTAERHPTVWQLTSTVVARTDAPLDRILQAMFPPASITGAPKRRAMEIISAQESSPRRVYTGTLGFVAPERRAQLNVAIRTVLLHRPSGRAEYGVGGGVVWDSTPSGEYEESLAKARVLSPRPRDFDLLETLCWSPRTGFWLLEHHLQRLAGSAEYFGYRVDIPAVRGALSRVVAGLPAIAHRVRLLVSRRGGTNCTATPLDSPLQRSWRIALAQGPMARENVLLYHKTSHRAMYEEALALRPGYDDVLLFNADGQATETTVANIAVEIDGVLYTPPLHCGLLPGTQRAWLLERGRLRERILDVREVINSPNLYLLNSVRGICKVRVCRRGEQAMSNPCVQLEVDPAPRSEHHGLVAADPA